MPFSINGTVLIDDNKNISSDTKIGVSSLGTGTTSNTTSLFGDGTWKNSTVLNAAIVAWSSRDELRSKTPENNELIFVESLGMFKFNAGSTEKDDDETCFRTGTGTGSGAWILEIPHWDFIHANMLFEQQSQVENINSTVKTLSDKIFDKTNSRIVSWNSRDTLRNLKPENNDFMFVESLGMFKFNSGSTEKDDDETCFRTASGAWILEIPHWDFIHANMIFENNSLNEKINDLTTKINDLTARIVTLETP